MQRTTLKQIALAVLVLGGTSAAIVAQQQVHTGRALDDNLQEYTMRSQAGHALDDNLRLGSGGYNGSVGMSRQPYSVHRSVANSYYTTHDRGSSSYYRSSANYTRNHYSVPYTSDAFHDALVRSGRNPNMNPGRAYSTAPYKSQRINTRVQP